MANGCDNERVERRVCSVALSDSGRRGPQEHSIPMSYSSSNQIHPQTTSQQRSRAERHTELSCRHALGTDLNEPCKRAHQALSHAGKWT
eukprot:3231902-Amphidinium_carterae.1